MEGCGSGNLVTAVIAPVGACARNSWAARWGFRGASGTWRRGRRAAPPRFRNGRRRSWNRCSVCLVARLKRSRNGWSPVGEEPRPVRKMLSPSCRMAWPPLGMGFSDGAAGVVVAVLVIAAPDERGFCPGLSRSIRKVRTWRVRRSESSTSAMPPLGRHLDAGEALLGLEDLARLAGEGRLQGHDPVAERDLVFQIAAVQRLHPDQRGGLARAPLDIARAGGHAVDGHVVFERQAGHFVQHFAGEVPNFDLLGKRGGRVADRRTGGEWW